MERIGTPIWYKICVDGVLIDTIFAYNSPQAIKMAKERNGEMEGEWVARPM